MKRTIALILVLVLVAALFVGCSPVGTYHIKTIDGKKPGEYFKDQIEKELDGKMSFDEYLEKTKMDEDDLDDPMELELKKNGKFTLTISMMGEEEELEGKWKKDGNSIILKPEDGDDDLELTIKGATLVLEEELMTDDEVKIVFAKGK